MVFLVDEIGQYMIYLKNLEEQIHLGNKEFSNRYVIFSKVESLHLICENINIGFEASRPSDVLLIYKENN